MAMTPYAGSDSTLENPSIVVSDDGDTWTVPVGLTNPVIAYPGVGSHNADPELLLGQDGKLYLYFMRRVIATNANSIIVVSSTDGITWSAETTLFTSTLLASPTVIWDGSQYVMWYVDASVSPYKVYRRTCATPAGTWSDAALCDIDAPLGKDLWHINVERDGSTLYMVLCCGTAATLISATRLYLAKSTDNGLTWRYYSYTPPLLNVTAGWDSLDIYRAATVRTATGFDLWYSADNAAHAWYIGRTTIVLS